MFLDHARLALAQVEAGREAAGRAAQPDKEQIAIGFLSGHELEWLSEAMHVLHDELSKIEVTIPSQYSPALADALMRGKLGICPKNTEAAMGRAHCPYPDRLPLIRSACHGPASLRGSCRPVAVLLVSRANMYADSPLDRAAHRRDDAAWIEAALADPATLFVPVWRARNLVRGLAQGEAEAVYITGEAAASLRIQDGPWAFLGLLDSTPVFACDLSASDDPIPLLPPNLGEFVDLRAAGPGGLKRTRQRSSATPAG